MPLLQKLGTVLFALAVVIVALTIYFWGAICQYRVQSDLRDFAHAVRKSTLSLNEKEKLLDILERFEDRLDQGEQIAWFDWSRRSQTVRELLRGGLEGDAAPLIRRELLRAEKHLADGE